MRDLRFIPMSALRGDNIVEPSDRMPWYQGETLLRLLETVHIASDRNLIDLRLPIQYVNRPNLDFRGFCGTMASGVVRTGDPVTVLPSGQRSRVKSLVTYDGNVGEAFPPMAITVLLEDEIDVSRGSMLVHPANLPRLDRSFEAMIVWMAEEPLAPGKSYLVKQTTNVVAGTVTTLHYRVDVNMLRREPATALAMNDVGRCTVTLSRPLAFDPYRHNRALGSFIVIDRLTNRTVGAGMIVDRRTTLESTGDHWEGDTREAAARAATTTVTAEERAARYGQQPMTVLLTGLAGAGKSTIAAHLERRLFDEGRALCVLDGRQMRQTISRDLGFSPEDRSENLRRAADVARLLNDSGLLCICAFLAPDATVREKARHAIGADRFLLVHVSAPIEVCRARDRHGIYARADSGEFPGYPGVTGVYEEPADADLVIDTGSKPVEACVDELIALLRQRGALR
jgi:bifunctional enzyme CysN/CysC